MAGVLWEIAVLAIKAWKKILFLGDENHLTVRTGLTLMSESTLFENNAELNIGTTSRCASWADQKVSTETNSLDFLILSEQIPGHGNFFKAPNSLSGNSLRSEDRPDPIVYACYKLSERL